MRAFAAWSSKRAQRPGSTACSPRPDTGNEAPARRQSSSSWPDWNTFFDPQTWIALAVAALELVLGIDNIVFISILVDRLPPEAAEKRAPIGLFLAMFMRLGLQLRDLAWIIGLDVSAALQHRATGTLSGRDLILIGGGLFLIWKSTEARSTGRL